jgi:hypothetical protein
LLVLQTLCQINLGWLQIHVVSPGVFAVENKVVGVLDALPYFFEPHKSVSHEHIQFLVVQIIPDVAKGGAIQPYRARHYLDLNKLEFIGVFVSAQCKINPIV